MTHVLRVRCCLLLASLLAPAAARAQDPPRSTPTAPANEANFDGIAARVEDDVILESELHELAAFQQLVDGKSKSRAELLRELVNQWVVRSEAAANQIAKPAQEDVDGAYQKLVKLFSSEKDFQLRCDGLGLTSAAVRRQLELQLYLSRYLDFKFRAAAQVERVQVEKYYRDELAPQLRAKGQDAPPLDEVEAQIRALLTERAISERAARWLDDARQRLRVQDFKGAKP